MRVRQLRLIIVMASVCVSTIGCGGRDAKPVAVYQNGDTDKTCEQLKSDLVELQKQADRLLPHTDKTLANGLWGTAGMFLVVPLAGMDLKNAEKVEFEAISARHNYLLDIAKTKGCPGMCQPIPSLDELRATKK
jgi:hypothetical protein